MKRNLVSMFEKLSDSEKVFIMAAINCHAGRDNPIHLGQLPFVSHELAVMCVRKQQMVALKKAKQVLSKLESSVAQESVKAFEMFLDDRKVRRWARGQSDEHLVLTLRLKTLVKSGLQWQEFGKKFKQVENIASHEAVLKRVSKNHWLVRVKGDILEHAKLELFQRLGTTDF